LRKILQGKNQGELPGADHDFSGVEYIDSSGLATLVEYRRDSLNMGLVCPRKPQYPRAHDFELVRLNEIIPIHPTVPEPGRRWHPSPDPTGHLLEKLPRTQPSRLYWVLIAPFRGSRSQIPLSSAR